MRELAERYRAICDAIENARTAAGRTDDVVLVAVSKRQPEAKVRALYELGHRDFGENQVQALQERRANLPDDIRWHFIGAIQSRKARALAELKPALIHSVDRAKVVSALAKAATTSLDVLVQVNVSREPQKAGVQPEDLPTLWRLCAETAGVNPAGLMALPKPPSQAPVGPAFAEMASLASSLGAAHLSMGMSADFTEAIAHGATHVRVGSALFGNRT